MSYTSTERVLIVGPSWVGDMVMAQSLAKTLMSRQAETIIDLLAPGWSLPIISRMPEVRRGIEMPLGHGQFGWAVRRRLGRELRGEGYTQAIVLPRSFKAALTPFYARIPRRTGYRGEMRYGLINDMRPVNTRLLNQTVQRFVALGVDAADTMPTPVPMPELAIDPDNQHRLLETLRLSMDRPVVGFMPGAEYGPSKCWPLEYFAELAATLTAQGSRVWIFGSDKDRAAGDCIAGSGPANIVNLCGRTRLEDAIDLLAMTRTAVTNDSGLMHVAAASGTYVVAIYGSTTDTFTPPLTERKSIIRLGLECSPCFERHCPLGHHRCMRDISVAQVLDQVRPVMI